MAESQRLGQEFGDLNLNGLVNVCRMEAAPDLVSGTNAKIGDEFSKRLLGAFGIIKAHLVIPLATRAKHDFFLIKKGKTPTVIFGENVMK